MRRFLSLLFVTACLLGWTAPAALACINDEESPKHEKKFKSDYLEQPPPQSPAETNPYPAPVIIAYGVGFAALGFGAVSGVALAVRRR
jgi:hypothetical protein